MMLSVLLLAASIILALVDNPNPMVMVVALGGPWAFGWHLTWQMRILDTDQS